MIWFLMFFLFFIMNLKDMMFINEFILMDYTNICMVSICPVIYLMVMSFNFFSYKKKENYSYNMFFFAIIILASISFMISKSFFFLMLVELCIYPMTFLILNLSKDSDKMTAMIFMFSLNMVGSLPFMWFTLKIMKGLVWDGLLLQFNMGLAAKMDQMLFFSLMLLSKLPIMFFHFWLTKAHVAASGPSSMILASIMLKLGSFGLFKFCYLFMKVSKFFNNMILSFSILTCLFFNLIMIRMFDVKYMIACSSIVHMSLILPFSYLYSIQGIISSMYMMIGHGLVSCVLFYLLTLMYEKTKSRTLSLNKSMESHEKMFSMVIFIFIVMNLGFPPFINFYTEMIFCLILLKMSLISCIVFSMSMISSILYMMFFLTKVLFGKKNLLTIVNNSMSLIFFMFTCLMVVLMLPFFC